MVILLLLAQIALVVLEYGAAIISVSPWLVFLPGMMIVALWLVATVVLGGTLRIDGWPVGSILFGPAAQRKPVDPRRRFR